MSIPSGWVVPENTALAHRPQLLYLPLGYAALLLMATLFLFLVLHYFAAAIYVFAFGWSIGKLLTWYDPYAWELLARGIKLPRVLIP